MDFAISNHSSATKTSEMMSLDTRKPSGSDSLTCDPAKLSLRLARHSESSRFYAACSHACSCRQDLHARILWPCLPAHP